MFKFFVVTRGVIFPKMAPILDPVNCFGILKKRSFGYFCLDVKTQDVYQSTKPLNHIIYEENFAKKLDIIYVCSSTVMSLSDDYGKFFFSEKDPMKKQRMEGDH